MNWKQITKVVGALNFVLGASMLLPLLIAVVDASEDLSSFGISIVLTLLVSGALYLLAHKMGKERFGEDLTHRDAFLTVTLCWVTVCFFGSLPFWISGKFGGFTNAYFEAVSGFTTTGSTILTDIASMDRATLFWRSIIQWFGGMGIIVLSLAVLPLLGVGGMQMFKAEVPGPTADKMQPRVKDTALLLWKVYLLLTVMEVLLLWVGGFNLFEAVCHA